MSLLERIKGPDDLKALPEDQLPPLAEEIRTFLVNEVSKTGGHLGPNLGVVELTIALHRVFDSPRDTIVFDTGHQAYVHKLLTGRHDFTELQKRGRALRLPEPRRVRPRRRRELPRLDRPVVGRRHRQGPAPARRDRTAHRRGHRRRRPHRRHGVGGDQQHRRRQGPAARHRRQRQRALLRADRSAASPTTSRRCARRAATSASSTGASARSRRRPSSAARCSRRCTASRRASRTSSPRRACSRTSG